MKINKKEIGEGKAYIIAEIGNNHNGDFDRAVNMVDEVIEAGADCAKFQMRNLASLYRSRSLKKDGEDLGTEYILDLLRKFELKIEEHQKLFRYCKQKGVDYMCTPWDAESVCVLENFGVEAYKVASADLTNIPLLKTLLKTGKPLLLSTGMSELNEILETVSFLNKNSASFALLHCNSTYPAPLHDINLNFINKLREIHPIIGYSGHERGTNVSIASVALGACIIERHFTLDRLMEGPDHAASLTKREFADMVQGIRQIELALGSGQERQLSQGEMINRENLGKSLVASKNLKKGIKLKYSDIMVRSPGRGLSPQKIEKLVGKKLQRNMLKEDFFYPTDLNEKIIKPREYNFQRPWGIPVRYHDFQYFDKTISPKLWEFHLSYADMELEPKKYLKTSSGCGFVVHAPELFSGSHLMDLASADESYRNESIFETQRVINITRSLRKFFPNEKTPKIIANVGGFTMDEPLPKNEISDYYKRLEISIGKLDLEGVELIPQTMAPFPWHFGGQRFQNLFVNAEDIVAWCKKTGMRMCFDISHSQLACNHLNEDFYSFASKVSPYTAHLHLGDAKGLNGEGLQIGDGEINFLKLCSILNKSCEHASFIPEIWQGHKNGGEGFWLALEKLEGQL